MLLQTATQPFDDPTYLFEQKINGVRLLMYSYGGIKRLFTRHGTEISGRFPEIECLEIGNCILDGELVCFNDGKDDFEMTMKRLNSSKETSIKNGSLNYPCTYVVFDVIEHNKINHKSKELIYRKEVLSQLFDDTDSMKKSLYVKEKGIDLFNHIKQIEGEGIVAKRLSSYYISNYRSNDWRKIINWGFYDCLITGFKKNETGWLIALVEEGKLVPAGLVEFGISDIQRKAFYGVAKGLIAGENKQYNFIDPVIRCKVKGRGRLLHSQMIHTPVFVDFIL